MVTACIKGVVERVERSIYKYRRFKNYDQDMFFNDLSEIAVCDIDYCDNVNTAYDDFVKRLTEWLTNMSSSNSCIKKKETTM